MKKFIALVLASVCVFGLVGCSSESSSIGIVGGADGPTAIFVSSNINRLYICGVIAIIVVAVLVALFIYRNKKKK